MKSAENKTTTASAQPQNKAAQPFFQKKGADNALTSGRDFFASEASAERFFQPAPAFIQAQLAIGAPNDPYEQEADKVAGQVMEGYDQASNIQRKLSDFGVQHTLIQPMTIGSRISRKIQRILSRTPLVAQAKCTDCEKEEKMQQKSAAIQFAGEGATVSPDIEAKIHSMRGGGQSMDAQTKGAMESSFGADFSNVRVHTGNQAVQMSQNLNAHAFTVGSDIFFNEGRYQPQTKQGAGLLAHELTHTVQQGAALQNKRIDRQPLANLLSGHTAAHLSAMSGQASLYRQGIAQLQRGPEEDLQMKGVDQVQKKDGAGILRRCGGGAPTTRKAKLKSGPTYTPNGTITPTVNANGSKSTTFTMGAEFEHDPSKGIYASCGEVRQYIKWATDADRPNHAGFRPAANYSADTWYEDRDDTGNLRYGHRSGYSSIGSWNEFTDSAGNQDQANGVKYRGSDAPQDTSGTKTGWWKFKLQAIDICNGNNVLGTDNIEVDW